MSTESPKHEQDIAVHVAALLAGRIDGKQTVAGLAAMLTAAKAEAWDEGYDGARHMARCWGHVDHWEDEPSNPYREASDV